jgi:hypothetical protein
MFISNCSFVSLKHKGARRNGVRNNPYAQVKYRLRNMSEIWRHTPMAWCIQVKPFYMLQRHRHWVSHSGVITPCTPLKINRGFGRKSSLHLQCRSIRPARNQHEAGKNQGSLTTTYSSTLKTKAICSSETLVDFKLTTRRYIQEDRTLRVTY